MVKGCVGQLWPRRIAACCFGPAIDTIISCTPNPLCLHVPQVQVVVEVRSGRWQEQRQFQLLECTPGTGIAELKQRAEEAAIAAAAPDGNASTKAQGGAGNAGGDGAAAAATPDAAGGQAGSRTAAPRSARPVGELDLIFLGQTCEDSKALRDYAICHDWIRQVAGFVLRPRDWRQ